MIGLTRLESLRDFLRHVETANVNELEDIENRRLAGKFATFEDYDGERDLPFERIRIASRAVGQELVNFVEGLLHSLAHTPWLKSNHKGPKTLYELEPGQGLDTLKEVSNLKFGEIINLVESYYCVSLASIDGWQEVCCLRDAMNNLKHRDGFKRMRDCTDKNGRVVFPQFEEITPQQAYDSIKGVMRFLLALHRTTADRNEGEPS